jgi:hypothetical protein
MYPLVMWQHTHATFATLQLPLRLLTDTLTIHGILASTRYFLLVMFFELGRGVEFDATSWALWAQ